MKNILKGQSGGVVATIAIMLVFMSAGVISNLTKRSNSQVVLHSTNVTSLVNRINQYYNQGYRVILSTNQDVAIGHYSKSRDYNEYGEVMVVMER